MSAGLLPCDTTVVLLAAGRGIRMQPLTDTLPKPLLKVGKHALIEHHLFALSTAGFRKVVINTAYLGHKIKAHLGNGARYGLAIRYSDESSTGALETAGGLRNALPLIESDPFLVINADIWTDFDFSSALAALSLAGRLILVPNPSHNPKGDFMVDGSTRSMTFSGIALYRKAIFCDLAEGKVALGPILKELIKNKELETQIHAGNWADVGTPERLQELNLRLNTNT